MNNLSDIIRARGLTISQACEAWDVCRATFLKYVDQRIAPLPIDCGLGRMIFDRDELERAFKARLHQREQ